MLSRRVLPYVAVVAALAAAGCEKVPLLAPSASTISVSAPNTVLAPGASTEVTASVIESGGTPVQNGTLVRFSATLGSVNPVEVETRGGLATTTFTAGSSSGTAEVRAVSGAASGGTGETASNLVRIQIGAAAATAVAVSATPTTLSSSGGIATITASALDGSGNRMSGVSVSFSTTAGSLSSSSATTDANGDARVFLTTTRSAEVTARAGSHTATVAVTVGSVASVGVSVSTTNPTAGQAVTVSVTPTIPTGGTAPRVFLNWGDGSAVLDLGVVSSARSASHVYASSGTYTLTATANADGEASVSSTTVIVGAAASSTIGLTVTTTTPRAQQPVAVRITPSIPTGASAPTVVLNWGDGTSTDLGTVATERTATHTYSSSGTYTLTATATGDGRTTTSSTTVTIEPGTPVGVSMSSSSSSPQRCTAVTFTATVTPTGESISRYEWEIRSNTSSENADITTTGNTLTRVFPTRGTKTISVRAVTPDGRAGNGQTQIVVVENTDPAVTCPSS